MDQNGSEWTQPAEACFARKYLTRHHSYVQPRTVILYSQHARIITAAVPALAPSGDDLKPALGTLGQTRRDPGHRLIIAINLNGSRLFLALPICLPAANRGTYYAT